MQENNQPTELVAKFHCDAVAVKSNQWSTGYSQEHIEMSPVSGQSPEETIFHNTTPGGDMKMIIANERAKGFFKPGKKYYVSFTEAE